MWFIQILHTYEFIYLLSMDPKHWWKICGKKSTKPFFNEISIVIFIISFFMLWHKKDTEYGFQPVYLIENGLIQIKKTFKGFKKKIQFFTISLLDFMTSEFLYD